MRAAAVNFKLNSVHCPFCRSHPEKLSTLIVCSDCNTYYHRECWLQNKGCSVFGCGGIMHDIKNFSPEPKWLIALRFLVFGFIVFSFLSLEFSHSFFIDILFAFWAILFMPTAPMLLLAEIVCLYQVFEHPELSSKYGKLRYHILSVSGYGLILFMFFVTILMLPYLI